VHNKTVYFQDFSLANARIRNFLFSYDTLSPVLQTEAN